MTKIISNPFFVYVISFALVILIYTLGWSALYPDLSISLVVFFIITFIISVAFGLVVHKLKRIEYKEITWDEKAKFFLLFVWLAYFLEFFYNKGIPLQMLIQGTKYDYTQFGIPVFHVFLVTFSSFVSVYIFHQLCSGFSKKRLMFFLLSIMPPVLIVSRGMLIITLTACMFVYLLSLRGISLKKFMGIIIFVLVVFFLFGIMGNLRQTKGKSASSEYIMETSKATKSFRNSIIPKQYIWPYLYISSPLANLQNTLLISPGSNDLWASFFNYEILPDFISKRLGSILEIEKRDMPRIAPWLTVSTLYARAYVFLGWVGIVLMFLFFITTSFVYLFLIRKSSVYYVTSLAILNTLVLYNTFDNMYMFSGLNLQLVYPLILSFVRFPRFTFNGKSI